MSDEDPFEIARRLDEFGAGKRSRPPKPADCGEVPARRVANKKIRPTLLIVFLILALGVFFWVVFQRSAELAPGFFKQFSSQPSKPKTGPLQAEPPKMIPSFDGKGEVPAFTVQVPGTNTPPPRNTPSDAN